MCAHELLVHLEAGYRNVLESGFARDGASPIPWVGGDRNGTLRLFAYCRSSVTPRTARPVEAAEEREYKPWLAPGDYSPADTIWVTADTRSTRDVPEARRGPPSCGYGYVEST